MADDGSSRRSATLERATSTLPSKVQVYVRPAAATASFTAVMVHGGLDGATSFTRLARRLEDADVVAYDRRGYRASRGAATKAGLASQVDDLREVVDYAASIGFNAPTVVVGHSFGGLIALAGASTDRPIGAAVAAYEPPFPWYRDDPYAGRPDLTDDPAAEAELFFRRIVGDEAWLRLDDEGRRERVADGPALLEDLRILRGPMPVDPTTAAVPVVIGIGEPADARRREAAAAMTARIPMARLEILSGAGHGAHLSSPDRLATLVRDAAARLAETPAKSGR